MDKVGGPPDTVKGRFFYAKLYASRFACHIDTSDFLSQLCPMGLHATTVVVADAPTPTTITAVGGNEGGITVRGSAFGPDGHLLDFGRLQ